MGIFRAVAAASAIAAMVSGLVGVSAALPTESTSSYIVELAPGETATGISADVTNDLDVSTDITETFDTLIDGFSAELTPSDVEALKQSSEVLAVYPDLEVSIDATQSDAPWNLSRLDQDTVPVDSLYIYPDAAGAGARIYVVDTGVSANSAQFGSRLLPGMTAISDGRGTADCNGHGTHVAGTAASTSYGVAKLANIVPVRVFGCTGSTQTSTVISGLEWIINNHPAGVPGIVNLSLGSVAPIDPSTPDALADAVNGMSGQGFVMVVAAGNSTANACNYSPARASSALTVAATTSTDTRASYSNFGSCVNLFAPGSSVRSLQWNLPSSSAVMSGTSMVAPHVAGVAALVWAASPALLAGDVGAAVLANTVANVVRNPGVGSPNRLLSVDWINGASFVGSPLSSTGQADYLMGITPQHELFAYPLTGDGNWFLRTSLGRGWPGMVRLVGAGDFDRNGSRDVIGVDTSGAVWLYTGNGNLEFPRRHLMRPNWSSVAHVVYAGDVNRDGNADVYEIDRSGDLWLWAGNGARDFSPRVRAGQGYQTASLVTGSADFTGDDCPDLVLRRADQNLYLASGDCVGGLSPEVQIGTGWAAIRDVTLPGDFDGDGISDLIARSATGEIVLHRGIGGGAINFVGRVDSGWSTMRALTAAGPVVLPGGIIPTPPPTAGVGDIDSDGRRDLVGVTSQGVLQAYRGDGLGGVRSAILRINPAWGTNVRTVPMGDFNGDSIPDLGRVTSAGSFQFVAGSGAGIFRPAIALPGNWAGYNLTVGGVDFDGDGNLDVIARDTSGNVDLFRGNGNGGWATGAAERIASGWGGFTAVFHAGDFDSNGESDLIARRSDGVLVLFPTDGRGAFLPSRAIDAGWNIFTTLFSPGDFDGDGVPDILAIRPDGRLYLYSGNGRGEVRSFFRLVDSGWQTMLSIL